MKFNYDVKKEDMTHCYNTKWHVLIDQFEKSEANIAEIVYEDGEYRSYVSLANYARCVVKRMKKYNIKVVQSSGHVYLEKIR